MEKKEIWTAFIEGKKKECSEKADALIKEGRADESRFIKAACNIYDVFDSLLNTSLKQSNGDEEKFSSMFLKLSNNVPENWRKSLEQAKAHDDSEKILIEEAKLDAADACVSKFREIYEVK